jgi:hypothetical protein
MQLVAPNRTNRRTFPPDMTLVILTPNPHSSVLPNDTLRGTYHEPLPREDCGA